MDEVSIEIAAPRDKVWDLIADFSNMGKWSPELQRIFWLRGANGPAVGARFMGINRHGIMVWPTISKVTKCDEGEQIEWEVTTSSTRWGYRFADTADGGTKVTEYREPYKKTSALVKATQKSGAIGRDRENLLRAGMQTTLERVKAAAEGA
ncbi:MAG: hypothetical protein QOF21_1567 [Actinomycetota bacterium]|jgi:uncharacterized protein YndB with AHSA1/START domain